MTIGISSDGWLGGSPLSISTAGYLSSGGNFLQQFGGGSVAGMDWDGQDVFSVEFVQSRNSQIINIVAVMVASGVLLCH